MNDDFEHLLADARLNAPPAAWRSEIVGQALRNDVTDRQCPAWWREWLWPCPQAWAGMAALWLIMGGMQFGSGGSKHREAGASQASRSMSTIAVLMNEELLWNEVTELPPTQPTPVLQEKSSTPRPRSRRRSIAEGVA